MRTLMIVLLSSAALLGLAACSGAPSAPAGADPAGAAAEGEVCPLVSPGPPPVCPDGCVWNGKECRKQGGIIIFDAQQDAGADAEAQ